MNYGQMKCVICGVIGPEKCSMAAMAWDWFTGYLPETAHFCPAHKTSQKRFELWGLSKIDPRAQIGHELLQAGKAVRP